MEHNDEKEAYELEETPDRKKKMEGGGGRGGRINKWKQRALICLWEMKESS